MTTTAQDFIQELLEEEVNQGRERGIQFAAYLNGRQIVDACAGTADTRTGRPVTRDTLFAAYSTGKGITATAAHLLAQRGVVDYDRPIAACWPEFGTHGKARITLRQALGHTAGIPQLPPLDRPADICDWDGMCRRVAALTPLWEPGSRVCYHAISFSWIVGETLRRLDGRNFAAIVAEEILRPLGIENELYFGIPETAADRVATVETATSEPWETDALTEQTIPPSVRPLEAFMNREDVRRACIPASNGLMTARAIARHYAALTGVDGRPALLQPETLRQATELTLPPDTTLEQLPGRFGLGYGLNGPDRRPGIKFGHGGYGGSASGFLDLRHGLAVGLTRNRTRGEYTDIVARLYEFLRLDQEQ